VKTIVFFHRLELTDLFAPVAKELDGRLKCVHLAFSATEAAQLDADGIQNYLIFRDEIAARLARLPEPDAERLAELDARIVQATNGAFSLNSAIQSDRSFSRLTYPECLRLTSAYFDFWDWFLAAYDVDHVLHEPVSLMFNLVASVALVGRGGSYLYCITVQVDLGKYNFIVMSGFDLTCSDIDRALADPALALHPHTRSSEELRAFLERFREDAGNFYGGVVTQSVGRPRLILKSLRNRLRLALKIGSLDRLLDAVDCWQLHQDVAAEKLRNLSRYKREVRFDEFDPDLPYYFYPLHLEPEAVVLYQAHGIYKNQVKLIENIAAQLPPGTYLYVKDHPHDIGYRSADDYLRLNAVPNIRLLPASIPGKRVIRHARGVITLAGTAGFEALMLAKPVVVFARTFYSESEGVMRLKHVRDLRETLATMESGGPVPDEAILRFLQAYLSSVHNGMTDYVAGQANKARMDPAANIRSIANGILASVTAL